MKGDREKRKRRKKRRVPDGWATGGSDDSTKSRLTRFVQKSKRDLETTSAGASEDIDRPEEYLDIAKMEEESFSESEGDEGGDLAESDFFTRYYMETDANVDLDLEHLNRPREYTTVVEDLGGRKFLCSDPNFQKTPISKIKKRPFLWSSKFVIPPALDENPEYLDIFGNILCKYYDCLLTDLSSDNKRLYRLTYSLHVYNHIAKTRRAITKNSSMLNKKRKRNKKKKKNKYLHELIEVRDQGFTRPKVLIILPTREDAYEVVQDIISYSTKSQSSTIMNKKRFAKHYHDPDAVEHRDETYRDVFHGNVDDHFRIGVTITKNTIRLFSDFYSSDIILASPLGLRLIVGDEGDRRVERDFDFLSSIEILIVDSMDVLLMQNWNHLLTVMNVLNRIPSKTGDTDILRVRNFNLDDKARYLRQNIFLARYRSVEFTSLFHRYGQSVHGGFQLVQSIALPVIDQVRSGVKARIVFHRLNYDKAEIEGATGAALFDLRISKRLSFFTTTVLKLIKTEMNEGTLVFVPDYYDFVRVRNGIYNSSMEFNFCLLSEYTIKRDVERCRSYFEDGRKGLMLMSERFLYFNRYRIRGVMNVVFYGLPNNAHFFKSVVEFIGERNGTVLVLFDAYDRYKLERIVGEEKTRNLLGSRNSVFVFR